MIDYSGIKFSQFDSHSCFAGIMPLAEKVKKVCPNKILLRTYLIVNIYYICVAKIDRDYILVVFWILHSSDSFVPKNIYHILYNMLNPKSIDFDEIFCFTKFLYVC